ncbi:MAG TPA: sigma-70 family RNA polymerase sigma factor [Candidatus Aminicenantes bacterium]|nr:sigma-70 family RNA polymerase sigma factor [Candidatus Aminicenantes bacterium]HRY63844.1 sigma-70 family RNA polymerase sigma factor [Candidatus Aminicenantes bacterium]HRZ70757.1 sigma-70 family RNA polymerase sigma factor [Candidatus Aminicenantes bacterium]
MTEHGPTEARTDEELAREARAGSRRPFEELASRYRRRLFVYLRSRVGSDEDAEDLVQETFLKLYRNIAAYDPDCRFSTWLYTSAGRLAIDAYRRGAVARKHLAAKPLGDAPDPEARAGNWDGASGAWDAARTLGGDRFRVLWLRYGEDMSVEEIAAVMGRSRVAVRVLLHRARTKLAERLGPEAGQAARPRPGTARTAVQP